MKDVKYNYYIDFIKFIFSIVIVIYHSWIFTYDPLQGYFYYGYLAVDFYFITTGYLMMNSISKKKKYKQLGPDTFNFLKGKIIKILPYLLLSYLISFILLYRHELFNFPFMFSNHIVGEILQLSSTGTGMMLNTATWYISSMMIALFILYPLARKYKDNYIYLIAPAILLFVLTFTNSNHIYITDPVTVALFGQNGLYKALIFIILGNYAYLLSNKFKKQEISKKNTILYTIIETLIYLILIITYHKNLFGTLFVALITLIAVAITFSNKSYTSKIFNHKIFAFLGKFGFIMYLNNTYVRFYVQELKPEWTYQNKFLLFMAIIIIISAISYIIVDILPKQIKKYNEKRKIIEKKVNSKEQTKTKEIKKEKSKELSKNIKTTNSKEKKKTKTSNSKEKNETKSTKPKAKTKKQK